MTRAEYLPLIKRRLASLRHIRQHGYYVCTYCRGFVRQPLPCVCDCGKRLTIVISESTMEQVIKAGRSNGVYLVSSWVNP